MIIRQFAPGAPINHAEDADYLLLKQKIRAQKILDNSEWTVNMDNDLTDAERAAWIDYRAQVRAIRKLETLYTGDWPLSPKEQPA